MRESNPWKSALKLPLQIWQNNTRPEAQISNNCRDTKWLKKKKKNNIHIYTILRIPAQQIKLDTLT